MKKFNILTITGPTASGKTALAVKAALKYGGEIISGDSRQVFRGMDIGTGKDLSEYSTPSGRVKYHLIDIAEPVEDYNLYRYLSDFRVVYRKILEEGKLPVLAGGSGLYIEAALKDYELYPAPEDSELRSALEKLTKEELVSMLRNESEEILSRTDTSSSRRIIRGIEIARHLKLSGRKPDDTGSGEPLRPLIIGIHYERSELIKRIDRRLNERLDTGMVDEVKSLLDQGVSHERLVKLGLEYRYCSIYLKGEMDYDTMLEKLKTEIHKFSKRQMTWFRGMERRGFKIYWINGSSITEAERIIDED